MKKILPILASIALGGCFILASAVVLFNIVKPQPPPGGTPVGMFFGAIGPTGFLKFVKVFEMAGGIIVLIPRLRNIGLLILGPIIVNIIAFHTLIDTPMHLLNPMLLIIIVCALYLLWDARGKFSNLLR